MENRNYNAQFIKAEESLLLVIDLQEKFVPYLHCFKRVLKSAKLLINVAKTLEIPIVVTEHNPEKIGGTVNEVKEVLGNFKAIRKDIFSCFGDEKIKKVIQEYKNVKNILITGCETHICIMQTTLDALNMGFNVHVAGDGVSSRKEIDWEFGLKRISLMGGVIATSEMISYELLKRSDIPEFKKLLPIFKEWGNN